MRAGRLKHRVRIENETGDTRNEFGEKVSGGWESIAENPIRAGVETLSTRDYFAAQEINNETTYKVVMRYLDGVTAGSRVVWLTNGTEKILELTGPPLNRNNQSLELMCRERV